MFKHIHDAVRKNLRPVKKYATRLEADLAREVLELYHIHALVITEYLQNVTNRAAIHSRNLATYLLVPQSDYRKAMRLLNYAY